MSARNSRKKNRFVAKPSKSPGFPFLLKGLFRGLLLSFAYFLSGMFFIFVYDCITQSDYLDAEKITITGAQTLEREELFQRAGIAPSINILSVNLDLIRKRLLAHPWIADASVGREFPGKINITITEHRPMAVIDFNGGLFFINSNMELFKEKEEGDPEGLPVVRGLSPDDVQVFEAVLPKELAGRKGEAVCQILKLGDKEDSILPNRIIDTITVDRDMGVALVPLETPGSIHIGMIRMGYGKFSIKYQRLGDLFRYLEKTEAFTGLEYVDLNNINGIVARPAKEDPALNMEKEV